MKKKSLIVIIDDHPLVREGMEQMLLSEGFAVRTADGGESAVKLLRGGISPDLLISDVRMPGMDGFETLARLRRIDPAVKILFLAGMPLRMEVARARNEGAIGYLAKSTPWRDLVAAIRRALNGDSGFLCENLPEPSKGLLTRREMEVIRYLNLGKTRDEIAVILGVGTETVKSHVKSIKLKLDATSTAGAVGRAYELGILLP